MLRKIISTRSFKFLRPIFKTIMQSDDLVLIRRCYSRMGGHYDYALVESTEQLKQVLRKLPPQTIIDWKRIPSPRTFNGTGLVPTKDGKLITGAY